LTGATRYGGAPHAPREIIMRHILIVSGISIAALVGSLQPGSAAPFCLISSVYLGMPECLYHTWAQCRASIGGGGDYCDLNHRAGYVFDVRDPANPRVVSSRRKTR
jgi:hypothetical protein